MKLSTIQEYTHNNRTHLLHITTPHITSADIDDIDPNDCKYVIEKPSGERVDVTLAVNVLGLELTEDVYWRGVFEALQERRRVDEYLDVNDEDVVN